MRTILLLLLSASIGHGAILHIQSRADYNSCANPDIMNSAYGFTNEISIAMWIKFTDTNNAQKIIAKGITVFPGDNQFEIRTPSGNSTKLQFLYANPGNTFITWQSTDSIIASNKPMHLAIVFNYGNGSSFKMYTNGVETAGSWTAGTGNQTALTNTWAFHFANDDAATAGYSTFNGWSSEVAIWNSVLTSSQVWQLYSSRIKGVPKQVQPDKLRSYYPSDDTHIETQGETGTFPNRCNDHSFSTAFGFAYRFNRMDSGGTFIGEKISSYQPNE